MKAYNVREILAAAPRLVSSDETTREDVAEVEVTLLAPEGDTTVILRSGDLFVVPAGVWHRSHARQSVSLWGATATEHDEMCFDDDPRTAT